MTKLAPEQEHALGSLVSAGTLSQRQADAVRDACADRRRRPARPVEIAGYLCAAPLLGGMWNVFPHAGSMWLLIAVTVTLVGTGVLIRGRATGVLLALAAVTGGLASAEAFDSIPALAGGVAALVLAVVGYAAWPMALSLLVAGLAGGATVIGLADLTSWTGPGLVLVGPRFLAWSWVPYAAMAAIALACLAFVLVRAFGPRSGTAWSARRTARAPRSARAARATGRGSAAR